MKTALSIITLFLSAFLCFSCSVQTAETKYAIEFQIDNQVVLRQTIVRGDTVYAADIPEREGFDSYWADEKGNRVEFPVYAIADKKYHAVYTEKIIKESYKIEYYLEQNDGSFAADLSKTKVYNTIAGLSVYAHIIDIDGYSFDENNPENVLQCITELGKSFTLKLYYVRTFVFVRLEVNGSLLKEIKVDKNRPFSLSDVSVPEIPDKRFVYWSAEPNGIRFGFEGLTCDTTLYAVYKDLDWSALSVVLETDLYYLIDESGEAMIDNGKFDIKDIEPGDEFVFSIIFKKGVTGSAVVAVWQTDDKGNTVSEVLVSDKRGYYTVKVCARTVIEISGLELKSYLPL